MKRLFVFGLGYTAKRIAHLWELAGGEVIATGRDGDLRFGDAGNIRAALADAEWVLSSVPPDGAGADPVLERYGDAFGGKRIAYLSSTGVYGDCGGAWVDETAPTGGGRRTARTAADGAWSQIGARVFRLPGIYGPGRSALDKVCAGTARRIDVREQVFSRVHVDDIARAVMAGFHADPGIWNLADDRPACQNAVVEEACRLLGRPEIPLQALEEADLSPVARAFYSENRRIAAGKARRELGWQPRYPTYREGLRHCLAAR